MNLNYIEVPNSSDTLYDGSIIELTRIPGTQWIVRNGLYVYMRHRYNGWYLQSVSAEEEVIPLSESDLRHLIVIDNPTPLLDSANRNAPYTPSTVDPSEAVYWEDILDKPDYFPAYWDDIEGKPVSFPVNWDDIQDKPEDFAILQGQLDVTVPVGGLNVGTEYEPGTSIETVLHEMLNPIQYPTFTSPSASLTSSVNTLLEDGATVNAILTVNFNRGTIVPAYGTDGYRSGPANGYSLNGGASQQNNTFGVVVDFNNKQFSASVSYDEGEQPKDSIGRDYDEPLAAGSVNTNTLNYEFVNALWANTSDSTQISKLNLISRSVRQTTFSFPACSALNPETFDVPAAWTVTGIQVKNDLTGSFDDCTSEFSQSEASHSNAGGSSVEYTRYSCNLGYDMGSRVIRIQWT